MSTFRNRRRIISPVTQLPGLAPLSPVDPRKLMSSGLRDNMQAEERAYEQQDILAEREAIAAERQQIKDERAAGVAQRAADRQATTVQNYAQGLQLDAQGIQHRTNPVTKTVEPVKDPMTGLPNARDLKGPVEYDPTGRAVQTIRKDGVFKVEDLDANADIGRNPDDPKDPNIYVKNKARKWDAFSPNDALVHPDPRIRGEAAKTLMKEDADKLTREEATLRAELAHPDYDGITESRLEDARKRQAVGIVKPEDAKMLAAAETVRQKKERLSQIGVQQAGQGTMTAEQFAAQRLASMDPAAVNAPRQKLLQAQRAGIDALKAKLDEEDAAYAADYEAFLPQTQGFTPDQAPAIREKMGQMALRKQMIDAKRQSLDGDVKKHNEFISSLNQQAATRQAETAAAGAVGVPQTDKKPTATPGASIPFDKAVEEARSGTAPWSKTIENERIRLEAMKADGSTPEAAKVTDRWLRVLGSMDPANAEDEQGIRQAQKMAAQEINAAAAKDAAANDAMKEQAKKDASYLTNLAQSGELYSPDSPEQEARAADWGKFTFADQHADAPAFYAPWGELAVNPKFVFRPDEYTKAVESSNAPPLAKEKAMQALPLMQQEAAAPIFAAFRNNPMTEQAFFDSKQKTAKRLGSPGISSASHPQEQAEAVADFMASPDFSPNWNQLVLGVSRGLSGLKQSTGGVASFFGSELGQKQGEKEMALQQREGAAAAAGGGSELLGTVAQGAMSLIPSLGVGVLTGGAGFGVQGAMRASSIAAGFQSGGSTMIEAEKAYRAREVSPSTAAMFDLPPSAATKPGETKLKARLVALGSGAITGVVTQLGGTTGAEAVLARLFERGAKETTLTAVRPALLKVLAEKVKGYGVQGAKEAIEETSDQVLQNALASMTYSPGRDMTEGLVDTALVGFILGGGVNAVTDVAGGVKAKFNAEKEITKATVRREVGEQMTAQHSPAIVAETLAGSPMEARTEEVLGKLAEFDARIVDGQEQLTGAKSKAQTLYSNNQLAQAHGQRAEYVTSLKNELRDSFVSAAEQEIDAAQPPAVTDANGLETPGDVEAFEKDKTRAKALVAIATGKVETLDGASLALVGLSRGPEGELKAASGKGDSPDGTARVTMANGELVISQATIDRMTALFPATAPLIGQTEDERRAAIIAKVTATEAARQPAAPAATTGGSVEQPAAANPGNQAPVTITEETTYTNSKDLRKQAEARKADGWTYAGNSSMTVDQVTTNTARWKKEGQPVVAPAPTVKPGQDATFEVEIDDVPDPVTITAATREDAEVAAMAQFPGKMIRSVTAVAPTPSKAAATSTTAPTTPSESAPAAETTVGRFKGSMQPAPTELFHSGDLSGGIAAIDPMRSGGAKQSKKGRDYGGFYAGPMETAQKYQGTKNKLEIAPDARVLRLEGKGAIERLSIADRQSLIDGGIDIISGVDSRGVEESVILNKAVIRSIAAVEQAEVSPAPSVKITNPPEVILKEAPTGEKSSSVRFAIKIKGEPNALNISAKDEAAARARAAEVFPGREIESVSQAGAPPVAKSATTPPADAVKPAPPASLSPASIAKAITSASGKRPSKKEAKSIHQASQAIANEIQRWTAAFPGGVAIVKDSGSAGFGTSTESSPALRIDFKAIADSVGKLNDGGPAWVERVIQEEVIHSVARQLETEGKLDAADLFRSLPAEVQAQVRASYTNASDDFNLGHEFLRMWVQQRIQGKKRKGQPVFTEDTWPKEARAKLQAALTALLTYFRDLAKALKKQKASPEVIAKVTDAGDLIEAGVRSLVAQNEPEMSDNAGSGEQNQEESDSVKSPGFGEGDPQNTPESLEGEKVDKEWTAFSEDSRSLGIPRDQMPQIKTEHRGALANFLRAGGIQFYLVRMFPGELHPTQAEYSPAKVQKAKEWMSGSNRAILTSSDNHVLDGHHQWLAALEESPDQPMNVIRLGAPIVELLAAIDQFPSAGTDGGLAALLEPLKDVPFTTVVDTPKPAKETPAPSSTKLKDREGFGMIQSAADSPSLLRPGYDGVGRVMESAGDRAPSLKQWLLARKDLMPETRTALESWGATEPTPSPAAVEKAPPAPPATPSAPPDRAEWQKTYRKFVSALTKAQNAANWPEVIRQAESFDAHYSIPGNGGFPDQWSNWERAKEDAERYIQRPELAPKAKAKKPVTPQPPPASTPAAEPETREAPGLIFAGNGVVFADSRTLQIAGTLAGYKVDHVGMGDFDVKTPKGTVSFNRLEDQEGEKVEGQSGRLHSLSGSPDAIEDFVKTLRAEGAVEPVKPAAEPASAPEAAAAPAAELTDAEKAENALFASLDSVLDGSLSAQPIVAKYSRDIPESAFVPLAQAARAMVQTGTDTPAKLAAIMTRRGLQYRAFSEAVWSLMGGSSAAIRAITPDWTAIYSELDNPAGTGDAPANGPNPEGNNAGGSVDGNPTGMDGAEPAGSPPAEDNAGTGGTPDGNGATSPDPALRPPGEENADVASGGDGDQSTGSDTGAGPVGKPDRPGRPASGRVRVKKDTGGTEVTAGRDVEPTDNLRIQPDDVIIPGNRKARIRANMQAIRLMREIGERHATAAEKRVLMQYSGWGDTAQVFGLTKIDYRDAAAVMERGEYGLYGDSLKSFESWKAEYGPFYTELKQFLTPQEWAGAKESSLNAHYTSREWISTMWDMVEALGFKGGKVVETSAGIGHFIGLTPDSLAGAVRWTGVELDPLTGQMLGKLYPKSDIQNIGFEKSLRTQNNSAELVIGNFPFGKYPIVDVKHPDYDGWSVHDYFLARSVDVVKPGGLVVAITSRFTMDATGKDDQRQYVAGKADLVASFRLPNDAFKSNAGTEVVTDILIFRKKDGIDRRFEKNVWASTTRVMMEAVKGPMKGQMIPIPLNQYYAAHPENVFGAPSLKGSMYGDNEYTVDGNGDSIDRAKKALADLPKNVTGGTYDAEEDKASVIVSGAKAGSYFLNDGKVFFADAQGQGTDVGLSAAQNAKAVQLVGLRDSVVKQLEVEVDAKSTDKEVEAARKALNKLYDAFVAKHGALNVRTNDLIDDDPEWPLLASLEDEVETVVEVTNKGQKRFAKKFSYIKGPMLLRRVNQPRSEPTTAATMDDAVAISMSYRGGLNLPFIAKLLSIDEDAARTRLIEEELAFENPETGMFDSSDGYLSGFVREKLAAAKRAAAEDVKFEVNVKALEAVQPPALPIEAISYRLGAAFVPPATVQGFLQEVMGVRSSVRMTRTPDSTFWTLDVERGADSTENSTRWAGGGNADLGVAPALGHEMVLDSLNLKLTEIVQNYRDENNQPKTRKLPEETAAARDMQERIQEEFKAWVRKTDTRTKEIEGAFNRDHNGVKIRESRVPSITHYPGAATTITLNYWQKRAVFRALNEAVLLAHSVGTGKTFTLITTAMEMRRLNVAQKPLIVVQNATLGQFARSFKRLYPNARLHVADSKKTSGDKRKDFIARAATGEWDAIIIPQSFFERLPNDPQREIDYVQTQLDEIEDAIIAAEIAEGNNGTVDFDKPRTIKSTSGKAMQRVRKRYAARMERVLGRVREKADDLITFDMMGVDALLVDEAHAFKRGDFYTKMDPIKGLDTQGSDRSLDFLLKTKLIHAKTPGKNIVLATGTPISNTLAEMWTMLRYIRPDLLQKFHVETFDDFAGTFTRAEASIEESAGGTFKQVLRLAKYMNGSEINAMWRSGVDIYTMDRADLKDVPTIRTGAPEVLTLPRTEAVGNFIDFIRDWRGWYDSLEGKDKMEWNWLPVVQFGLARKAAVDMRLINPELADDPGSKTNRVVEEIFGVWESSKEALSTQAVFSNLINSHDPSKMWLNEEKGIPNPLFGKPAFNLFADIKAKLIARGVPAEQIVDFSELKRDQAELYATLLNEGVVRIAMGSTETLGTGLNFQNRLKELYHLDIQFRPMDNIQRNGRAVRQGNQNKEVGIRTIGMDRTLDSTLANINLKKSAFIAQAEQGKMGQEFEDPSDESTLSFQDMTAAFSGNPLAAKRFALVNSVRKLEVLQEDHFRRLSNIRSELTDTTAGKALFDQRSAAGATNHAKWENAFAGKKITSIKTGDTELTPEALGEKIAGAYAKQAAQIAAEYASGALRGKIIEAHNGKTKADDWWKGVAYEDIGSLNLNGVPFFFRATTVFNPNASFGSKDFDPATRSEKYGQWGPKPNGYEHLAIYQKNPWESTLTTISGNATTATGLIRGVETAVASMLEATAATEVERASKRITNRINELREEQTRPWDQESYLTEQKSKLDEVEKELAEAGETEGEYVAPAIDEIVQKYPDFAYITRQGGGETFAAANDAIEEKLAAERSSGLYFRTGDTFTKAPKSTVVEGGGFKFFARKDGKGSTAIYRVTELSSGIGVSRGKTAGEAIANLKTFLATPEAVTRIDEGVRKALFEGNMSPRAIADDAPLVKRYQPGDRVVYTHPVNGRTVGRVESVDPKKATARVVQDDGTWENAPLRYVEPAPAIASQPIRMDEVDRRAEKAEWEYDGARTVGDPSRAGGAGTGVNSELNDVMLAASDIYAEELAQMPKQRLADLDAVARSIMQQDPEGNLKRLIADRMNAEPGTALDVRMTQMLKEWLARQPATPERRQQAASLAMGDHLAKRTASQILGASRDMFITKSERFRAFMFDHIYLPPPAVRKAIEEAPNAAARTKLLEKDQERLQRIIAALGKMGVTVEDVLNGGRKLVARREDLNRTTLKGMDAKRVTIAMDAMDATLSFKDLASRHGVTVAEAKAAKAEAVAKVRAELKRRRQMAQRAAGMIASQPMGADPWVEMDFERMAGMSDADAEAEMDAIMKELGWFPDEQQGKRRTVTRRVPKARVHRPSPGRPSEPAPIELNNEIVSIFHGMDIGNQVDVVRMKQIVDTAEGRGLDMIREIYINFLLSGPVTQATNFIGNVAFGTYNLLGVRFAESMVNSLTGNSLKESASFGEFVHIFRAAMPALLRGAKMAKMAWGAEYDFFEDLALGETFGKAGDGIENIGGKKAVPAKYGGRIIRMPGRSLMAADSGLKTMFGTMEVAAHAYRLSKAAGLKPGSAEFETSMNRMMYLAGSPAWDAAVDQAKTNAFQQDLDEAQNRLDWFPKWVMKAVQSENIFAKVFGTAFFPFVKTPYNIAKTAVVNSPLGTAYLIHQVYSGGLVRYKDGKLVFNAEPLFVKTVAQQILAWTAFFVLRSISEGDEGDDQKNFLITGSPPKSRAEADLQKRALGGAYRAKLGNFSFNYGRIEPFATVIASAVDVLRSTKRGDDAGESATKLLTSLAYQAQNKTFLTGLASIGDILEGRTYGQTIGDMAQKKILGSIVPNLIKQPMRNWNDSEMDTKDAPWWHAALPLPSAVGTRVDPGTGEEKQRSGNAVTRLVMPSTAVPSAPLSKSDKILLEWNRTRKTGGDAYDDTTGKAWAPGLPSSSIQIDGQTVDLNANAVRYLTVRSGTLARKMLENAVLRVDQDSVDAIKKAYKDARDMARDELKARPLAQIGEVKK